MDQAKPNSDNTEQGIMPPRGTRNHENGVASGYNNGSLLARTEVDTYLVP
jgi:hypothetical protein